MAELGHFEECAAAGEFDVVGMSSDCQHIKFHWASGWRSARIARSRQRKTKPSRRTMSCALTRENHEHEKSA